MLVSLLCTLRNSSRKIMKKKLFFFTFQYLDRSESDLFFEDTLPHIIRMALELPELVPSAIPLLMHGQNKSISLSQQQIACLLANAFLCTFPDRSGTYQSSAEFSSFPSVNFSSLFQTFGNASLQKIRCFCNYFRRQSRSSSKLTVDLFPLLRIVRLCILINRIVVTQFQLV